MFNDDFWRVATSTDDGELEGCQLTGAASSCDVWATGATTTKTFTGLNTSWVRVGASCTTSCDGGGAAASASAVVTTASVTISDPTNPTANDLTGTLAGGSNLTGTQSVTVSGSDTTGIKSVDVLVDGNPAGSTSNSNCDYTYTRPCAQVAPSFAATFNVDLTALSNGTHSLTGRVYDAAGNMSTKTSSFTVTNPAPPTPPTGGTGGGGGNPPPPPSPASAQLRLSSAKLTGKKAAASGTLATNASGKVTVKLTWRDSKKKSHSKTYSVKRNGSKWSLSTNFTPRKASMSVRFTGNAGWASTSIVKSLSVPKKKH